MKLALHRSVTFWSGFLVMGFICWAWWDSVTISTNLFLGCIYADHSLSRFGVGYDVFGGGAGGNKVSFHRGVHHFPDTEFLPAPEFVNSEASWQLVAPHWLLLLAFVLPWSSLLLWRARRRKRAYSEEA